MVTKLDCDFANAVLEWREREEALIPCEKAQDDILALMGENGAQFKQTHGGGWRVYIGKTMKESGYSVVSRGTGKQRVKHYVLDPAMCLSKRAIEADPERQWRAEERANEEFKLPPRTYEAYQAEKAALARYFKDPNAKAAVRDAEQDYVA